MTIIQSLKTAISALLAHKGRSFLTTLGIIIGISSVITLVSLGKGLEKSITAQLANFGSDQIYVLPGNPAEGAGPAHLVNRLRFDDTEAIKNITGVSGSAALIEQFSTVTYKNRSSKAVDIIGTEAIYYEMTDDKVTRGSFFSLAQEKNNSMVAVLGPSTAKDLFASGNPLGKEVLINGYRYQVIGVLEEKGSVLGIDIDKRVYIPIGVHRKNTGIDHPTSLIAKIKSGDEPEQIARQVERAMLKIHKEDEFAVMTQEEALKTVKTILGVLSGALAGIAAISLLVGGIGVMNIMLVSVTERTREIGLRKSVGARPRDILIQFLIEAIVLSLIGGIIGISLGFLGGLLIHYFLPSLSPQTSLPTILLASLFSALVGIIFGVVPAYRASRLNPIEALKYE